MSTKIIHQKISWSCHMVDGPALSSQARMQRRSLIDDLISLDGVTWS